MTPRDEPDDVFAAKDRLAGIGLIRDPHPKLRELREAHTAQPGSLSSQFGIVGPDNYFVPDEQQVSLFDFHDVERVFRDPITFSSSYYGPPLSNLVGRTIVEMDPPDHQRYRSLVQGAFTKKEMQRWERDFVRAIVETTIDRLAPLGRGDLAADFAFFYPITVIAAAVGLPVADVDAFYEKTVLLTALTVDEQRRVRASEDLRLMVLALIEERRAEPADDLVSILLNAELPGVDGGEAQRLTDDEIVTFVRLLVPAGAQTTYRTLTNLLYGLLTNPDQLDALYRDRSLIPRAVEEGVRWEPPLMVFSRNTTVDTEVAGCPVAAGTTVNVCVHAANRDPDRWPDPDRFDMFRPPTPHLSFGQGNHICLGMHFARMELRVALEVVLDRLPNLRLDPAAEDVHISGLISRTALHLPCLWDVR